MGFVGLVFLGFVGLVWLGKKGGRVKKVLTGCFDMVTKPPHAEGMGTLGEGRREGRKRVGLGFCGFGLERVFSLRRVLLFFGRGLVVFCFE